MDATLHWTGDPSIRRLVDRELARGYRWYYRQVRAHVRNPHDAEDVLQEFCVRAMTRCWQIRQSEKAGAWLSQVLRSAIVDHFRRHDRHTVVSSATLDAIAAPLHDGADADEERSRSFETALTQVSPQQALLIRKLGVAGQERRSVASELDLTTNALGVRYHRALQALKQQLGIPNPPVATEQWRPSDRPARRRAQAAPAGVMRRPARRLKEEAAAANV